jgi:hypothetical protein
VTERDVIVLVGCVALAATGFYIMAEPRRLFMRADEPARFRPEAVEYDSPQGVRIRRLAPFYAFGPIVFLLAYWLAGGFRG